MLDRLASIHTRLSIDAARKHRGIPIPGASSTKKSARSSSSSNISSSAASGSSLTSEGTMLREPEEARVERFEVGTVTQVAQPQVEASMYAPSIHYSEPYDIKRLYETIRLCNASLTLPLSVNPV